MTWTIYNDVVAYNADIPYNGKDMDTGTTVATSSNRHAAVPWREQRGRSHIWRRKQEDISRTVPMAPIIAPKPEVTPSRTIAKIILAPDRAGAEAAILDFVKDKESRQQRQPALPDTAPTQSYSVPPKLPAETAGELAATRHEQARSEYQRRQRDDSELFELVGLLEGF